MRFAGRSAEQKELGRQISPNQKLVAVLMESILWLFRPLSSRQSWSAFENAPHGGDHVNYLGQ